MHAPRSYANGAAGALRPTREICANGAASVMPPAAAPAQRRASARCGGHGSAVRALRNTCFLLSTLVAGAFGDARNRRPTDASPFCWPHALRAAAGCCTGRCYRRVGLCVAGWVSSRGPCPHREASSHYVDRNSTVASFRCAERERSIVHFRERRVKSYAELFVRRGSPPSSTRSWRPFVPSSIISSASSSSPDLSTLMSAECRTRVRPPRRSGRASHAEQIHGA